ncbi:MAG: hypothetical protein AABW67_05115 [Nanoarchaeota archaeon]
MAFWILPIKTLLLLGLLILVLAIIFLYLYKKNKKIYKDINSEQIKYRLFKERLQNIEDSIESPEKDLEKVSRLAKDFFKEYYNLSPNLTYLELSKKFKDNPKKSVFCKDISDLNYSGNNITSRQIELLKQTLSEIIREEAP